VPHPQSKRAKAAKRQRAAERQQRSSGETQARAERQTASEERQRASRSQKQRRATMSSLAAWLIGIGIVGGLGFVLFNELRPGPELAGVERPSSNGRGHVDGATYATATPTSGAHSSSSPRCGVSPTPLDPALAVHALEHGVVVLWYDAARTDIALELSALANTWDSHVIVAPSNLLSDPIVATSWNRIKAYPEFVDEIDEFVETYRQRGPERVPCNIA